MARTHVDRAAFGQSRKLGRTCQPLGLMLATTAARRIRGPTERSHRRALSAVAAALPGAFGTATIHADPDRRDDRASREWMRAPSVRERSERRCERARRLHAMMASITKTTAVTEPPTTYTVMCHQCIRHPAHPDICLARGAGRGRHRARGATRERPTVNRR
jgi:hypothetical protein